MQVKSTNELLRKPSTITKDVVGEVIDCTQIIERDGGQWFIAYQFQPENNSLDSLADDLEAAAKRARAAAPFFDQFLAKKIKKHD